MGNSKYKNKNIEINLVWFDIWLYSWVYKKIPDSFKDKVVSLSKITTPI